MYVLSFLLFVPLVLLGMTSTSELGRQLSFFLAEDQLLLNVALVTFVNVRSTLVGLFFKSTFNHLRVVSEQFLKKQIQIIIGPFAQNYR